MELLTLKNIAKKLGRPESTLRWWRDRFAEYVPWSGEGRTRMYPPEAVKVFAFIEKAYKRGDNATQIKAGLSQRFPVDTSTAMAQYRSKSATQRQGNDLVPMDMAGMILDQREAIAMLTQRLAQQEAAFKADIDQEREARLALENKLGVLEAELVAGKRRQREFEAHMADKIKEKS
ncbi:MerR family transcriptional regulator [Desulfovibrio inopinatus]|uniref:MerR family transcriptional regulator n=1 Tax=Desulfovibrio inopinatus TaxID=102109 RepID=UPI0004815C60|nr:MerR family transcriptional regulator [Desulfovibrio inopinatus]